MQSPVVNFDGCEGKCFKISQCPDAVKLIGLWNHGKIVQPHAERARNIGGFFVRQGKQVMIKQIAHILGKSLSSLGARS